MNKWLKLGKRSEKVVYISEITDINDLAKNNFSSSLVLLVIHEKNIETTAKKINLLLNNTLKTFPLALHFCGKSGNKAFDIIFNNKVYGENKKHTMTGLTEGNKIIEWIEGFFNGSLPCEERFDEWKDYRIIIINNHLIYNKICKKISEFLKYIHIEKSANKKCARSNKNINR
ncbi:MAG: hypothetical protein WC806_01475 [Candidatus Gracilibacteria bacterium]|jgi:hypothetical protein